MEIEKSDCIPFQGTACNKGETARSEVDVTLVFHVIVHFWAERPGPSVDEGSGSESVRMVAAEGSPPRPQPEPPHEPLALESCAPAASFL